MSDFSASNEITDDNAAAAAAMPARITAAAPTPAETNAIAREEVREAAERRQFPAARALVTFLRDTAQAQKITGKGDGRTNIIDQGDRVTYAFPPETVAALFAHLEAVRREGLVSHFSERQGTPETPTSGLMLDYDIHVADPQARLHERHVHRIACQVVRALRRDLVFPADKNHRHGRETTLHVFTIVKPEPVAVYGGGDDADTAVKYKYGFHVLIPGIRVSRGYKKYLLRALRDDGPINGVLTDLGVLGDPRECLDMNSASVPVLFLGSCKRGGTPYVLGPSFEVTFDAAVATAEGAVPHMDDADFYPMVRGLRAEDFENYNLVAETSLCFEAVYPEGRPPLVRARECTYRPELASEIEDLAARTQNGALGEEELLLAEHSLSTLAVHDPEARYLHQILDLLDPSYHTDRNKWRDVVFALANTSETYKPLAEWFSHKCPLKWADGGRDTLDQIWEDAVARRGAVANPLTKRSLIRWAQVSNPERFRQISDQNYFTILAKYVYDYGGILEHFMVAEVLHAMLGNKFIVDVDEGVNGRFTYCWFEFVVPGQPACVGEVWKWRKEVQPDELQNYISKNLVKVLDQVAQHIEEQRADAETDEQGKYYQKLGAAFLLSRRKIFNDQFKNGVIKQANYLFRRRGFVDTLDQEPTLLGTGNGILRLGAACTLIDHFHEYPVMKFTPVHYRPFNPDNPWTKLMLNALADIIPEPDFRDWLLFFAASSLAGGVKEGLLLLWHGGGANGKTWFMRMTAKVLGKQYATKLDIGLLTAERSKPNDPNSAMMQLKGMRWGYVEETRKAEPMNDQRLKEIVNPGEISGNEKFKQQETFEVTANVAVGQNYDFVVDTTDHGTWRRIKHYHSKVRFTANPDPSNPYEKKDDQRYVREYINDPDCQAAFLSILVHYYERLQREHGGSVKNVPCPTLDRETEIFRNGQDTINRFITERVVHSPGNNHSYPLATVAGSYIEWYNTNIDRRRHVASEIIQDIENSALAKHIRRAPNKTMVLHDCRVLAPDSRTLEEGETYMGVIAPETTAEDPRPPPAGRLAADWWNPPLRDRGNVFRGARVDNLQEAEDFLFDDDDSVFPEPRAAKTADAAHLLDDDIEDILTREEYAPWDEGARFTVDDVFEGDVFDDNVFDDAVFVDNEDVN